MPDAVFRQNIYYQFALIINNKDMRGKIWQMKMKGISIHRSPQAKAKKTEKNADAAGMVIQLDMPQQAVLEEDQEEKILHSKIKDKSKDLMQEQKFECQILRHIKKANG